MPESELMIRAKCKGICEAAKDGFLELWDGPEPEALEPEKGNHLIAELRFTTFHMDGNSTIEAGPIEPDQKAKAKGIPTWFRVKDKKGRPLWTGPILNTEPIYEGSKVNLDYFAYTLAFPT